MRIIRWWFVMVLTAASGSGLLGELGTPAQLPCTLTLSPPASIQQAIHDASPGAILCLEEGSWEENITIYKSLQLRGAGQE